MSKSEDAAEKGDSILDVAYRMFWWLSPLFFFAIGVAQDIYGVDVFGYAVILMSTICAVASAGLGAYGVYRVFFLRRGWFPWEGIRLAIALVPAFYMVFFLFYP